VSSKHLNRIKIQITKKLLKKLSKRLVKPTQFCQIQKKDSFSTNMANRVYSLVVEQVHLHNSKVSLDLEVSLQGMRMKYLNNSSEDKIHLQTFLKTMKTFSGGDLEGVSVCRNKDRSNKRKKLKQASVLEVDFLKMMKMTFLEAEEALVVVVACLVKCKWEEETEVLHPFSQVPFLVALVLNQFLLKHTLKMENK
jgi:hypothetical protein